MNEREGTSGVTDLYRSDISPRQMVREYSARIGLSELDFNLRPYRELCSAIIAIALLDLQKKGPAISENARCFIMGDDIEYWIRATRFRVSADTVRRGINKKINMQVFDRQSETGRLQ